MPKLDVRSEVLWANQLQAPIGLQTTLLDQAQNVINDLEKNKQAIITITRNEIENQLKLDFDKLCTEIGPVQEIDELGVDLRFLTENSNNENPDDQIQLVYFIKPEEQVSE